MKKLIIKTAIISLILNVSIYGKNTASLYIQPYIQNVSQTEITILWWTRNETRKNNVKYGQVEPEIIKKAASRYIESVDKYLHEATITNLKPENSYHYFVKSDDTKSGTYTFHTAVRTNSDFHFVILGDGRTDNDKVIQNHRAITKIAFDRNPDFAFHLGDMVYSGDQIHWDRFWRRICTNSDPDDPGLKFASSIPYYLVVGNHEIYSSRTFYSDGNLKTTMARYKAYVSNPKNNSKNDLWEERYYSFRYGVASFIILDTNNTSNDKHDNHQYLPDGSTPDWEPNSEQYLWLLKELEKAQKNSVFTFIVMHPAPYSRGPHGAPDEVQSGYHIRILDPVFREYGVDAVFCAHDHHVERCLTGPEGFEKKMDDSDPRNLNYFIIGNSGQSARKPADGWQSWIDINDNDGEPFYSRYFYDWVKADSYSFLDVDIEKLGEKNWQATFQIIRDDLKMFDKFSIVRESADLN